MEPLPIKQCRGLTKAGVRCERKKQTEDDYLCPTHESQRVTNEDAAYDEDAPGVPCVLDFPVSGSCCNAGCIDDAGCKTMKQEKNEDAEQELPDGDAGEEDAAIRARFEELGLVQVVVPGTAIGVKAYLTRDMAEKMGLQIVPDTVIGVKEDRASIEVKLDRIMAHLGIN